MSKRNKSSSSKNERKPNLKIIYPILISRNANNPLKDQKINTH